MLESIALMNGFTDKMNYLQVRQRVLSQNISNADTPGYQSMEVKNPDFGRTLARYSNRSYLVNEGEKIAVSTTNSAHVAHKQMIDRKETGDRVRQPYEVAPAKNSVNIEDQMMQASQTAIDYQLATNLYNKNVGMLRAAMK